MTFNIINWIPVLLISFLAFAFFGSILINSVSNIIDTLFGDKK